MNAIKKEQGDIDVEFIDRLRNLCREYSAEFFLHEHDNYDQELQVKFSNGVVLDSEKLVLALKL